MANASEQASAKRIPVFFYGSFMRREMLARGGFYPERIEAARLSGYDISFCPYAHITRSDQHSIYGILTHASHEELGRLYSMPGIGVYLPEAVLVETQAGALVPALTYIAPSAGGEPPDRAYIGQLAAAAREHGLAEWYIARLESF